MRKNLVVACGKTCPRKQHAGWLSVDPYRDADFKKPVEELTAQDLQRYQFDIVYFEGITCGVTKERLNPLLPYIKNALVISPGNSQIINTLSELNFKTEYFIISGTFCIFIKNATKLKSTVNTCINELLNKNSSLPQYISALADKIESIKNKFKNLDPILISTLAHIEVYIEKRKDRARNYFKDKKYNDFLSAMHKNILSLNIGQITLNELLKSFGEWLTILPSSRHERHKLNYDPLKYVITNIAPILIQYYSSPSKEVKIDDHFDSFCLARLFTPPIKDKAEISSQKRQMMPHQSFTMGH